MDTYKCGMQLMLRIELIMMLIVNYILIRQIS